MFNKNPSLGKFVCISQLVQDFDVLSYQMSYESSD